MAQAALNEAGFDTGADVETPQVSMTQAAFDTALAALKQGQSALDQVKAEHKETLKTLPTARDLTRAVAWAAFDHAVTFNSADDAKATAQSLAKMICEARGIEGDAVHVYTQRARAMIDYKDAIAKAAMPYVAEKGKNKGETINPREKADPFYLAQKMADVEAAKAKAKADRAAIAPLVRGEVALVTGMSEVDVMRAREDGDEAIEEAYRRAELVITERQAFMPDWDAMLLRLAEVDTATQRRAYRAFADMFGEAFALTISEGE